MKYPIGKRSLGLIYMILSALGILFFLTAIIGIWLAKPTIEAKITEFINIFHDTLKTTDEALIVLDSAIEDAQDSLNLVENSLTTLGGTVENISDSLFTSADLLGEDISLTILETQSALSSAATSAEIIDDTLSILASIPLIGVDYQPEVPLHISLEQVAASLEDTPDTLETIEGSLTATAKGLETMNTDIEILVEDLEEFRSNLTDARVVTGKYGEIVAQMIDQIENLENNLSSYTSFIIIFLTGVLFWLGVSQSSVFIQGREFWQGEQKVVNLADIERT